MPSGYERSPDYGGPPFNPRLAVWLTLCVGLVAVGLWVIFRAN